MRILSSKVEPSMEMLTKYSVFFYILEILPSFSIVAIKEILTYPASFQLVDNKQSKIKKYLRRRIKVLGRMVESSRKGSDILDWFRRPNQHQTIVYSSNRTLVLL